MPPHKFTTGQKVVVRAGSAEGHIPTGVYTISRTLPGDDFDRAYRVLHGGDGHERVVREKQLEAYDWARDGAMAEPPAPARRKLGGHAGAFGKPRGVLGEP